MQYWESYKALAMHHALERYFTFGEDVEEMAEQIYARAKGWL